MSRAASLWLPSARSSWSLMAYLFFCLLGAATPFLTVLALRSAVPISYEEFQKVNLSTLSVGIPTGLIVGSLVGFRRGHLRDLLLGPAIGLAVGFVDLYGMLLLLQTPISVNAAYSIPIWGALMGTWAGLSQRRWWRVLLAIGLVAGADYVSRFDWPWLFADDTAWPFRLSAAFVYAPASFLAVALTRKVTRINERPNSQKQM